MTALFRAKSFFTKLTAVLTMMVFLTSLVAPVTVAFAQEVPAQVTTQTTVETQPTVDDTDTVQVSAESKAVGDSSTQSVAPTCDPEAPDCVAPAPSPTFSRITPVKITSIVCPNESMLPNWGAGGQAINDSTITQFLNAHPACHPAAGWQFQYGDQNAGYPGNGVNVDTTGYTTFSDPTGTMGGFTTQDINTTNMTELHLREVLQPGYVPFTGQNTDQNVSAEFYCNGDALNYDNWDFIRNPGTSGSGDPEQPAPYNCVAFNAPVQMCAVQSDTTNVIVENGANAVLAWTHSAWADPATASIPLAKWIWSSFKVAHPDQQETRTFMKQFTATGTSAATLQIAADNGYLVKINGATVVDKSGDEANYGQTTPSLTIPLDVSSYIHEGNNTIEITVTNFGVQGATDESNPAGLLYTLKVSAINCDTTIPTVPTSTLKVHIYKYLQTGEAIAQVPDDSTAPAFPMSATWSATNIGSGTGSYVLGTGFGGAAFKYAADTAAMSAPASYTTSEVTSSESDFLGEDDTCVPGKYRLVGYKTGSDTATAEAAEMTTAAPQLTGLVADATIIVINEKCADAVNTAGTVVVEPMGMHGWSIWNYDASNDSDHTDATTVSGTKGSFVTGPTPLFLGEGSFEQRVGTDGDDADRIVTNNFNGTPLANITQLAYSTFVSHFNGAQATYVKLLVDTDNDGAYDDALYFEPVYQNGTYGTLAYSGSIPNQCGANPNCVELNTWQTWNLKSGGWWSEDESAGGPPITDLAGYIAQHPNAKLATDVPSVRIQAGGGAGAWDNFVGNFDQFVIGVQTGSTTHVTTYDFQPDMNNTGGGSGGAGGDAPAPTPGSGGGNGGHAVIPSSGGSVLGASTGPGEVLGADTCAAYITDYIKEGAKNDKDNVSRLQTFLNDYLKLNLKVDGIFGKTTVSAVKQFQSTEKTNVLTPWKLAGYNKNEVPTGYVYKTTKYRINMIKCPTLAAPAPEIKID